MSRQDGGIHRNAPPVDTSQVRRLSDAEMAKLRHAAEFYVGPTWVVPWDEEVVKVDADMFVRIVAELDHLQQERDQARAALGEGVAGD